MTDIDIVNFLKTLEDNVLHELMTNLAGHDLEELSKVFSSSKKSKKAYLLHLLHCERFWSSSSRT